MIHMAGGQVGDVQRLCIADTVMRGGEVGWGHYESLGVRMSVGCAYGG